MDRRPKIILISGNARLPQECTARALYDLLTVTTLVETNEWTIVSVDVNLVTETARSFVKQSLLGKRLLEDSAEVVKELEFSYWGGAKKAVIAAIQDLGKNLRNVETLFLNTFS